MKGHELLSITELNHVLVVYGKAERNEAKMRLKMAIRKKSGWIFCMEGMDA